MPATNGQLHGIGVLGRDRRPPQLIRAELRKSGITVVDKAAQVRKSFVTLEG